MALKQNRDQSLCAARVVDHLLRPEEVLVLHVVDDLALEICVSRTVLFVRGKDAGEGQF